MNEEEKKKIEFMKRKSPKGSKKLKEITAEVEDPLTSSRLQKKVLNKKTYSKVVQVFSAQDFWEMIDKGK